MKLRMSCMTALALLLLGSLSNASADCSRGRLEELTEKYFESLTAHSAAMLPLAEDVTFTENGVERKIGEGFWQTAGKPLLRRTLIDTAKCSTAVIAVVEEPYDSKTVGTGMGGSMGAPGVPAAKPRPKPAEGTVRPILFAVRLKVENDKISEVETIVARENEFMFNPEVVLSTKDQDWRPFFPEKRTPRKVLADAANHYFDLFKEGSTVSVPFAECVTVGRTAFLRPGRTMTARR